MHFNGNKILNMMVFANSPYGGNLYVLDKT